MAMGILDSISKIDDEDKPMAEYIRVQDAIDFCKESTQHLWDYHIELVKQFTETTDERKLKSLHEKFDDAQQELFVWRYYIPQVLRYIAERAYDGEI